MKHTLPEIPLTLIVLTYDAHDGRQFTARDTDGKQPNMHELVKMLARYSPGFCTTLRAHIERVEPSKAADAVGIYERLGMDNYVRLAQVNSTGGSGLAIAIAPGPRAVAERKGRSRVRSA
jgi:hypothetical protein